MLIVAKQDNIDNLFAIWNTVTDRFMGVNLDYVECLNMVKDYKDCSYVDAKNRVDHPQPFDDIAKQIYWRFEPEYADEEQEDIRNAVRMIVNHYRRDGGFKNAFLASIESALKELPKETELKDVAKAIADRIIGEE